MSNLNLWEGDSRVPGASEHRCLYRPGRNEQLSQYCIPKREQLPPVQFSPNLGPPTGLAGGLHGAHRDSAAGCLCLGPAPARGQSARAHARGCSHATSTLLPPFHTAPVVLPASLRRPARLLPSAFSSSPPASQVCRESSARAICARSRHSKMGMGGSCSQPGCLLGKL